MKRNLEVVRKYEDHYEGRGGYHLPCPACGNTWTEPSPVDRSRELVHTPNCDYMKWLREPDPEDY